MSPRAAALQSPIRLMTFSLLAWLAPLMAVAQEAALNSLPAEAVFVMSYAHGKDQQAGYEKTAAFDAFEKTGLMPAFHKLWKGLPWEQLQELANNNSPGEFELPSFDELQPLCEQFLQRGYTVCIAIPENEQQLIPYGVVVLHGGGEFLQPLLNWIKSQEPPAGTIQPLQVGQRKVTRFRDKNSPVEAAVWVEGNDLFAYVGQLGVEQFLANKNRLVDSPEWKSAWDKSPAGFVETSRLWFNFERLRTKYGAISIPIPETEMVIKPNEALDALGLTSLKGVATRTGYQGRHLVTLTDVLIADNATGWLSLKDQTTVTLADLPPLPATVSQFQLQATNWPEIWKQGKSTLEKLEKFIPEEYRTPWHTAKTYVGGLVEIDLEQELLQHLGPVVCTYGDSAQEVFGIGASNIAISMKDPKQVKKGIDRILKRVQQLTTDQQCKIIRTERHGYVVYAIQIAGQPSTFTFALCDQWLVYGGQPQTVEAFLLRAKGVLPKWSADNFPAEAKAKLPAKFTQLTYSDPRGGVRFLISLTPFVADYARAMAQMLSVVGTFEWESPISALDIPPAELVVQPLFPNVSFAQIDGNRLRQTSLNSTGTDNAVVLVLVGTGIGVGAAAMFTLVGK